MATTIGQLDVRMNLELQRLEAQIDTANKRVATMSRRMHSDVSKAAKNINRALGSIGLGLSAGALVSFGKQVLDLGGQITDLSNQAGLSTDAFQAFSNVASESGVDAQQIANSFVQMRRSIQDAADGSKVAADALNTLGLTADQLQQLAPERQFEAIAKSIVNATDKNKAFNAGLDILGAKNAPKLTEVLQRLGTDGFDAVAKATEGLRINQDQLKTLDDAGDKLTYIWTTLKVLTAKAFIVTVKTVTADGSPEAARLSSLTESAPGGFMGGDELARRYKEKFGTPRDSRSQSEIGQDNAAKAIAQLTEESNARKAAAIARNAEFDQAVKLRADLNKEIADGNALYLAEVNRDRDAAAATERYNEAQKRRAELIVEGAAVTRANLTPLEEYNRELSRLVELKNEGVISAETYDRAVVAEGEAYQKATSTAGGYGATLDETEEKVSSFQSSVSQMWESIADRTGQALADLLLDSEAKFKDFAALIARTIAETALRLAVINPIINSVFGLSGASALPAAWGARASGGPMSAGGSYLVGENGPELVTPTANSMVTPSHALAAIGGSGGNTYNIDARGADMAAVARIEQSLYALAGPGIVEKRAKGAIADERRRGGGLGRAFGA